MKTALSALAMTFTLGALSIACSSESSEPVSANSALDSFQNPTGSFTKETGGQALSGYKAEQAESSKVERPGGSAGGTKPQSLRLLTKTLDSKASCNEGQSCACVGGGSFSYRREETKAGQAARFQFDSCVGNDNAGFDGQAILLVTSRPLLGISDDGNSRSAPPPKKTGSSDEGGLTEAEDGSPASEAERDQNLLFAARGTAIEGNKRTALDFALAYEKGYTLLAVEVKDGKVVVGLAPSGTIFVKAKQGSWVCTPSSSRGYQCKSSSGGDDVQLDGEASSDDGASPPEAEDPKF
jgi:putative hemolysin